ncbi:MAG: GIY-YIG nuclease family protein [Bacteroidales bacterium]|nr:GIY-YIG nuclease family protein [Bacteroidales bacterium]
MPFYTYILHSEKLDKYYIGSTGDLKDRIDKHNRSQKGFTSTGKPWILVYSEAFDTKAEAMAREIQLKNWKNRDRLEAIIKRNE